MQNQTCQSCKNSFAIAAEDTIFYQQMKVPTPTFCPDCRLKRRLIWRNERSLYKRTCDLCKENIFSAYHPESPYTVYCSTCWWSDAWNPEDFAREYDFSKSFFVQFDELMKKVPRMSLVETNNVDSNYCNYSIGNNRLYYSFASHRNEDSGYLQYSNKLRQSYDCLHTNDSDLTVGANYCDRLYRCAYVTYTSDSSDCILGYDLHNCTECIGCVNLRNASYQIFNVQYTKEAYFEAKKEILRTNKSFEDAVRKFKTHKENFPVPESYQTKCVDCIGNDIREGKNLKNCFSVKNSEDSKFVYINAINIKNCYDANNMAFDQSEYLYECQGVAGSSNMKFCDASWNGNMNIEYGSICFSSNNLFGCVGIRGGNYQILNKKYTKEAYTELREKIITHMNKMPFINPAGDIYRYGEFFPTDHSLFAYNESIISQYFPLTKEEALEKGYRWINREQTNYTATFDTNKEYQIDTLSSVITDEILPCMHKKNCKHQCPGAFTIKASELETYQNIGIPLPTLCSNCRHFERLNERGGYIISQENCMCQGPTDSSGAYHNTGTHIHTSDSCGEHITTVFTDELHPIRYCRDCFQREIL